MHYYIDGYNLLFRTLKTGDDLKKQRAELTLDLEAKLCALGVEATLVFDSHYQEGDSVRSHFKSLEIIFTALGKTADDFILHELKETANPSNHTVVTSDKKLSLACRLRLAKTETVEEFLSSVNKRYKSSLKAKQEPLQPLKKLVKEPVQKPLAAPSKKASIAPPIEKGSFEYYLNTFEANSKHIEKEKQAVSESKQQDSKSCSIKTPKDKKGFPRESAAKGSKDEPQSDMERWLKAFEQEDKERF